MINKLIDFSIQHKLLVGLLTLAMALGGIWSMGQVPIDAVPDITNNQVQVITQAPNLGTEDIEQFVTYPVELGLANIPGVVEIRSVSRFGLSVVTVVFEDDMGTYLPRQLVSEKLNEVKEKIPQGFGTPHMGPITTGLGEIYQYTLEVEPAFEDQYSATDLRTIQDWIVQRQMAMVPGVVEVNAFGGQIKQYEVAVSPDELKSMGLTIGDLYSALQKNNQNTGGAYIERNHQANFIRGEGLARNLDDIRNTLIKEEGGIPIRIKDVAQVKFGQAVRYGAFTKDGNGEAVGGMVLMLRGANSDNVIQSVKARVSEIQHSLPEGVRIAPFLDRSKLVAETTSTVKTNLMEGGLIVIFVLVILLGNWRGGLIVASTIPLSLLFAFILMYQFDVWANLMSLGAIDFGIIVDGAVIIVESTVFYLHQKVKYGSAINQHTRDQVTSMASKKMMNSAFFGQLIILIVFLPILALEGVEGKMFHPMALTFSFAMLGAMILCLTYVPMMSALLIKVRKDRKPSMGDRIVGWLENKYEPLLGRALQNSRWLIGLAAVLLGLSFFTFTRMGGEFMPQLDEGDLAFHIIMQPGSSLSESVETSSKIEKLLLDNFPEVEHAMTRFGVAEVPTDPMPMDLGDCVVILKPRDEWTTAETKEALIDKIKDKLNEVPGVSFEFTQPIEMRFNELLTGVREDIAVKLFGEDLDILAQKAQEMGQLIAGIPGVGDMRVEATTGLPQITVGYQREKLAQYHLHVEDLNQTVETAFAGKKAGVIFEGEKRFDLVLRLDEAYRKDINDVKNLYVATPNGAQIPLKEVADISYQPGPMQISRDNTHRRTYVGINVRGRDIQSLVQEIQEKLNRDLTLPPGYYIRYGGAFENFERATERLKLVVPIALGLIFILIYFALGSIRQTLMIYMAIPLAAIGGIFSLWIRGMPFSISAGIGFIVLFGVAVLNGLVLINGFNELKEEGVENLERRIQQGGRRRVRPILLTALTDILGFLPMALAASAGAEVQRPLATVVIGGLITSTLLTLFVIPVLYQWIEKEQPLRNFRINPAAMMLIGSICLLAFQANAQETKGQVGLKADDGLLRISLDEAKAKARKQYPSIQSRQLEIQRQEVLKKSAWDLGTSQLFTGGEELQERQGVYTTIGIQQQQMDIFGIGPKRQQQKQAVALSKSELILSKAELDREVGRSFGQVYVAKKRFELLEEMDSLYQGFEQAARLRWETEESSKLEWLAAQNQAKKLHLRKDQAWRNYRSSIFSFNRWWGGDRLYTVDLSALSDLTAPLDASESLPEQHPELVKGQQQIKLAQAAITTAKADFLPKLNFLYGVQRISGQTGFYTYQLGLNIPLGFSNPLGKLQSAKIQEKQANLNWQQTHLGLESAYSEWKEQYQKWQNSWIYYQKEALPLARQQQAAALLAYQEGAIDYVAFIQHVQAAMEVELNALDALDQLLQTRFQFEFFITTY